jgi:hypothetical protein
MRRIFTLLIGLVMAATVQGQTLLFSENFETNTLPDSVTHTREWVYGKEFNTIFPGITK